MFLKLQKMRPPMDWGQSAKIALTLAASLNNSFLGFWENLIYGRQIREHEVKNPVFILGHWRSGTTLLHNMLSSDPQFVTTDLYHVLGFPHFLLTRKVVTGLTGKFLPKTRPMDNMEVSWEAPQEDESILCNETLLSPYLMVAFHNRREVYQRYFDLLDLTPDEMRRWKAAFLLIMKKITLKNNKIPLLKSPTHSYRVKTILEMFPQAKFINIIRNPYAVFPSTVHLRRQMFRENGFAKPNMEGVEEDLFQAYEHLFTTLERDKTLIPPGQYIEMKYEDFEQDILGELKKIYEYFQMPGWTELEAIISPQIAGLKQYKKNEFKMEEGLKRQIYERCKPVFEKYGYPSLLDEPAQVA